MSLADRQRWWQGPAPRAAHLDDRVHQAVCVGVGVAVGHLAGEHQAAGLRQAEPAGGAGCGAVSAPAALAQAAAGAAACLLC